MGGILSLRLFDQLQPFTARAPIPVDPIEKIGLLDVNRRYLATKLRQAEEQRFLVPGHTPSSRLEDRLPPGQSLVRKWPVLDLNIRPKVNEANWRLTIDGFVHQPVTLSLPHLRTLPQVRLAPDIHCVTSWSRFDMDFSGVLIRDILDRVRPKQGAAFVLVHSLDGYTTNLTLDQLLRPNVMLASSFEGKPLNGLHGGPVRLIVPDLYFWKSAKWIRRIEIRTLMTPGFWETRGYHRNGDPWRQERYSRC
jgi:DMSO/TMAO reductase YedYZ molybdopterin-dependent catalytic subunit